MSFSQAALTSKRKNLPSGLSTIPYAFYTAGIESIPRIPFHSATETRFTLARVSGALLQMIIPIPPKCVTLSHKFYWITDGGCIFFLFKFLGSVWIFYIRFAACDRSTGRDMVKTSGRRRRWFVRWDYVCVCVCERGSLRCSLNKRCLMYVCVSVAVVAAGVNATMNHCVTTLSAFVVFSV